MQEIAKSNGNNLPEGVILALDDEVNKAPNGYQSCSQEEPGSMVDITRSPAIRIQLFLSVAINFTCSVVYYGISLNVVNLETDLHLSVLLNAVAEMLAFTITTVLLGRFGRKPLAIATQWFSAIFCLMGCFVGNVGIWKAAQMGAILAPLLVVLGRVLPFLVFGICGLVGGLFAFYLPETMNKPSYDTTGGIEEEKADWRIT
ncbi:hypothetical protein V6N12_014495 [Hibiscus sabdariffa]|uniref:Uncharacterized protein n=1 Tax=Hibiscus sabdariffa TaxID=183260 RepID=A0ABR2DKC3_9ROSI